MKHFKLTSFLTSNLDILESELEILIRICNSAKFKRNEFILKPGEKCSQILFVTKGLLRQFSIDEKGKEHNLTFAPENWLITDRASMFFNEPTNFYIQALEDTEVLVLNEDFFKTLSNNYPNFNDFNVKLLQNHIRQQQNRINSLLSDTAKKRYLDFIKMYPDLNLRIPQTMIASYLGITPESLSRVRKELTQKK